MATLKEAREQIITLKEEIDRLAQPPSGYGVFLAAARGRHGGRVHRRPQAESGGVAVVRGRRAAAWARSAAQRRPQRRRRARLRAGRRSRHAQGDPRGRRPRTGASRTPTRSGRPPRGDADRSAAAGRRLAADRAPVGLRLRAHPQERGRGAGSGGGAGRRLHDIGGLDPDRADPRRRGAALPARGAVPRAPAAPAQGRAALRSSRLRQDADRQGGRELAGQEDRRAARRGEAHQLLPQHQGSGAAQQVRRRDRAAHPADLPAGPGEGLAKARR